jgi:hypothetical protein
MASNRNEQAPTRRKVGNDSTLRLAVRSGDYLLWVAIDSPFGSDSESAWSIRDFWQVRDGDSVTMTNRWVDLPVWFELHPLEVSGRAVIEMTKELAQGFQPSEPLDGPNFWRVKAGDRLVWVTVFGSSGGVREIFDFSSCALVLGETNRGMELGVLFGAPDEGDPPPEVTSLMRKGFEAAARLGTPRRFSPEWLFGA